MSAPKRDDRLMTNIGRAVAVLTALLLIWATYALFTHKPTTRTFNPDDESDTRRTPKQTSTGPVLRKLNVPVFDYLPAGAVAGFYLNDPQKAPVCIDSFAAFKLFGLSKQQSQSMADGFHGPVVFALYIEEDGSLTVRGAVISKDSDTANLQQESLKKLSETPNPLPFLSELHYAREGNVFAFASSTQKLVLLSATIEKPVKRLSISQEVQAAFEMLDGDALAFANPSLFSEWLDAKFPVVVAGELPISHLIKALDLHAVNSVAIRLRAGGDDRECKVKFAGVRGEGLLGLISRYDTDRSTAKLFPSSTLLYASQTIDFRSLIQSMGGAIALTSPADHAVLPANITSGLSMLSLTPTTVARAFDGEAAFGIALDGLLPSAWIVAHIGEMNVIESLLTIAKAQNAIAEKEIMGVRAFVSKTPILSIRLTDTFTYNLFPAMAIIDDNFVVATSTLDLQKTIALSKGNAPSLAQEDSFSVCAKKAQGASSFVFARPSTILRVTQPLLSASGIVLPDIEIGDVFYSYAKRDYDFLELTTNCPLPMPFANYIVRPEWIPLTIAITPFYDRCITMAIRSANWVAQRLYYYDYEHLDLTLDLTDKTTRCIANIRVRNLVDNSTGFTFAFNPGYEIKSVKVDGEQALSRPFGPFLMIRSNSLIAKDKVCNIEIVAEGYPEDMTLLIPQELAKAFHYTSHPVRRDKLMHYGITSLFYPSPPALRDDLWTSKTTLIVPKGWRGVTNGRLESTVEGDDSVTMVYVDDRPDQTIEVLAAPFEMKEIQKESYTMRFFFEPSSTVERENAMELATDAYTYFTKTFGGDYDKEPTVVFLADRPGISHCLSFIVIYSRKGSSGMVIPHELAHLWWGSHLRMNPIESEMWYEGLAEYSTIMFVRHKFGDKQFLSYLEWAMNVWRKNDRPPVNYRDVRMWSANRGLLGYYKGVALFRGLETLMGEENFVKFLQALANKGRVFARVIDLWETAGSIDPNLNWYMRSAFGGNGVFDIEIRRVSLIVTGKYEIEVRSSGMNHWRGKATLLIKLKSGAVQTVEVGLERTNRAIVEVNTPEPIEYAILDPIMAVPDYTIENNTHKVDASGDREDLEETEVEIIPEP